MSKFKKLIRMRDLTHSLPMTAEAVNLGKPDWRKPFHNPPVVVIDEASN